MSKATRKARASAARPGTIAADPRIIIDSEPALTSTALAPDETSPNNANLDLTSFFSGEELAAMPLVIRATTVGRRVRVWRDGAGDWWRTGGSCRVLVDPNTGQRSFVITLHKGATVRDVKFLLACVGEARAGTLKNRWRKLSGSDDRAFRLSYDAREYGDPYSHSDHSERVVVCGERLCGFKWHPEDGKHVLDRVAKGLPANRGEYDITVSMPVAADPENSLWTLDVYTDEFYGNPDDVASFVVDLQWLQEECRRANAARGVDTPTGADGEQEAVAA